MGACLVYHLDLLQSSVVVQGIHTHVRGRQTYFAASIGSPHYSLSSDAFILAE